MSEVTFVVSPGPIIPETEPLISDKQMIKIGKRIQALRELRGYEWYWMMPKGHGRTQTKKNFNDFKEDKTMNVETMREHLRTAYSMSTPWQKKLKEMSDNQVIAVYYSLVKRNKIKGGGAK